MIKYCNICNYGKTKVRNGYKEYYCNLDGVHNLFSMDCIKNNIFVMNGIDKECKFTDKIDELNKLGKKKIMEVNL